MKTLKVTKRHLKILKDCRFETTNHWSGYPMCGEYDLRPYDCDLVWEYRGLFKESSCFYNKIENKKLYNQQERTIIKILKDIPLCLQILSHTLSLKVGTYVYNEKNYQWELKKGNK